MTLPAYARKNEKGYILLYAVIIFAAVILAISIYSADLATFSTKAFISARKSKQARYLADTCAETALQKIWDDNNFVGSDNISLYGGECDYQVTNTGGDTREIRASGEINNIIRKVKVSVLIAGGQVGIVSWKEVSDF